MPQIIRCSKCSKPIKKTEGFGGSVVGGETSSLDTWFGNVCTRCEKAFCADCIKVGGPTPCPNCGNPTYPAMRRYIREANISFEEAKSSNCFIATAACGSDMEYEVVQLRTFRDKYILTCWCGHFLIACYEHISPPVARLIERHAILRSLVRRCILRPLTKLVHCVTK